MQMMPALSAAEKAQDEYRLLGLSTGEQLLAHYRQALQAQGVSTVAQTRQNRNGASVRVAGLVVVHQAPPTAKGHHFLTLEDETGLLDVIVRPRLYARQHSLLDRATILIAQGILQRNGARLSILGQRFSAVNAMFSDN